MAMEIALERHDRLLTDVIEQHGGVVVTSRGEGDSFFAVFPSAVARRSRRPGTASFGWSRAWPEGAALRVRMGLHTGEARVLRRPHRPRPDQPLRPREGGRRTVVRCWSPRPRDLVEGRLGGGFGLHASWGSSGCATWSNPSSSIS